VRIKRPGWANFVTAVFGTVLNSGDLVRVEESATAKIVCTDLTLHDLGAGVGPVPCTTSRSVLRRSDGTLINATRSSPAASDFPIILSPRKTFLLSPRPILRWTPVKGSITYNVIVRGPGLYWTTQIRSTNQVAYPPGAPALKEGVDYKLVVETNGKSSAEEPGFGLGFTLVDSKIRKAVLKAEAQILDLHLPNGPTQFLLANLYSANGLNAEAILKLELVSKMFPAAAISRRLADLYMQVGLSRQAETEYLASVSLSRSTTDEEGEMLTHLALAQIYELRLGNKKAAEEHLESALALAKKIGDESTATWTGKKLIELEKAGG